MPTTALLVLYRGGWRAMDAVDPYRRIEGLLAIGAIQHPHEADRIARSQLNLYEPDREEITIGVEPIGETDCPYLGYNVGDTIGVEHPSFTSFERVVSLAVSEDTNGRIQFAPQLKDHIFTEDQRNDQAIKKMSNGTLRGDSKVATPAALIDLPKTGPTCCPPPLDPGES